MRHCAQPPRPDVGARPKKPAEIPPYDEWAQEAELTWWFGDWRDPKTKLGIEFLYEDGAPRHEYPKKDDWMEQAFPVAYSSDWARGRLPWEVWLDAVDAWHHEVKRLAEVYYRKTEFMDNEEAEELHEGKFPHPPNMPDKMQKLYRYCSNGDIIKLASIIEDPEVDVNCRDQALQTPLMNACCEGSIDTVEYLVDMGADVTFEDCQGDTAFDWGISALGERYPDHPVLRFLKNLDAPRGKGYRSKLKVPGL